MTDEETVFLPSQRDGCVADAFIVKGIKLRDFNSCLYQKNQNLNKLHG